MPKKLNHTGSDHRIRVLVPDDDAAVIAWLNEQLSVSLSVRMLIRDAVRATGVKDYFSTLGDVTAPESASQARVASPESHKAPKPAEPVSEPSVPSEPAQRPTAKAPAPSAPSAPVPDTDAARSATDRLKAMQGLLDE